MTLPYQHRDQCQCQCQRQESASQRPVMSFSLCKHLQGALFSFLAYIVPCIHLNTSQQRDGQKPEGQTCHISRNPGSASLALLMLVGAHRLVLKTQKSCLLSLAVRASVLMTFNFLIHTAHLPACLPVTSEPNPFIFLAVSQQHHRFAECLQQPDLSRSSTPTST